MILEKSRHIGQWHSNQALMLLLAGSKKALSNQISA